jgi:hypothetical protein
LLEKNGRRSSSRRTRHINIQYFFVTDWIQSTRNSPWNTVPLGKWSLICLSSCYREALFASSVLRFWNSNLSLSCRDNTMVHRSVLRSIIAGRTRVTERRTALYPQNVMWYETTCTQARCKWSKFLARKICSKKLGRIGQNISRMSHYGPNTSHTYNEI